MPIIDFHGKKAIQNYEPPYHILEEVTELNYQSNISGNSKDNILIEGDNLLALKSLLPEYEGKIKCIYIDPPYNTNNKDWVYCDNIEITSKNDPAWKQVEKFLKDGNEVDYNDQSRHSKWLCMMYPRIKLLHRLLKDDGVIFVSIDDNEVHHLRMVMDEIWGEENFVGDITWIKKRKGSYLSKNFVSITEHILVYSKKIEFLTLTGGNSNSSESQPLIKKSNSSKILQFPKGIRTKLGDCILEPNDYGKGNSKVRLYDKVIIENEVFQNNCRIQGNFIWTQENLNKELQNGVEITINTMNLQPRFYRFEEKSKGVLSFIDGREFNATTEDAFENLTNLFHLEKLFDYSKPKNLIKKCLEFSTNKDDIILDSFAGSGTTAHAVLALNNEDNGNRKFITVQLPEAIKEDKPAYIAGYKYVHEITKARIEKVAGGYTNSKGDKVEGLGGGFRYYRIGTPLFTKKGNDIVSTVTYEQLAPYIYFTEFKTPIVNKKSFEIPKVGEKDNIELYLLYSKPNQNTLTEDLVLKLNKQSTNKKIIYADSLELGIDISWLKEQGIIFKQIPYDILII